MILFFGPPGSGKSVQGELLVKRNQWQWLSTGDLFRKSKDPEVISRLATGDLIDDELTNRVLSHALESIDAEVTIVLDGYPRNLEQVHWLERNLGKYNRKVSCIILFDAPREELIKRLSARGRAEDDPKVINHRLDIYDQKTTPVLELYRSKGFQVHKIDGRGDVQEVHERIQATVVKCLSQE